LGMIAFDSRMGSREALLKIERSSCPEFCASVQKKRMISPSQFGSSPRTRVTTTKMIGFQSCRPRTSFGGACDGRNEQVTADPGFRGASRSSDHRFFLRETRREHFYDAQNEGWRFVIILQPVSKLSSHRWISHWGRNGFQIVEIDQPMNLWIVRVSSTTAQPNSMERNPCFTWSRLAQKPGSWTGWHSIDDKWGKMESRVDQYTSWLACSYSKCTIKIP
jgi:hypothetical protein